jgi:hypothetical protein
MLFFPKCRTKIGTALQVPSTSRLRGNEMHRRGVETQNRMASAVAVRVAPDRVSSGTLRCDGSHSYFN